MVLPICNHKCNCYLELVPGLYVTILLLYLATAMENPKIDGKECLL